MTDVKSVEAASTSLTRDLLYAARYYLGNRWVLVGILSLAAVLGLYFGGWGWLVAAGLAPIILSALPCLIMCAFGVCMMCRSQKQAVAPRDAADTATSATALGAAKLDRESVAESSCCQAQADEPLPTKVKQLQPIDERRDAHA